MSNNNSNSNGMQSLSERLTNLSNSKSYVFLGRGNNDGNATATTASSNNSSKNKSHKHIKTSSIHNSTNLSRDAFMVFELLFHHSSSSQNSDHTIRNLSGDYEIRIHEWTLRQLYRYVVSSIKTVSAPHTAASGDNNNNNSSSSSSSNNNNSPVVGVGQRPRSASTSATSHIRHNHNHHHHHHHQQQQPKWLGSNLHPRDMRRLVTPFSASNEPELIVRRHVMVFNFDPIRAIITRDRLLVKVPIGADSILKKLEDRIVGRSLEFFDGEDDDDDDDDLEQQQRRQLLQQNNDESTFEEGSNFLEPNRGMLAENNDKQQQTNGESKSKGNGGDLEEGLPEDEDDANDVDQSQAKGFHQDNGGGDDDDWSDMMMEMEGQKDLTFELLCVNACLSTVFETLANDTEELQEKGLKYVQDRIIGDRRGRGRNNNNSNNNKKQQQLRPEDALAVIRNLKVNVKIMQARVKGFVQSINRILNEDEDMALMNVSRLVTHPENFIQPISSEMLEIESDEPELVLESNLNNALTLSNALDLIQGQVDTASDLIDARMDAARNKFLLASLCMSIASLSLTAMTCVSGIFGMNLNHGLEEESGKFAQVTFGSLVSSIVLGIAIFAGMVKTGVITGMGPVDQDGIDSLF